MKKWINDNPLKWTCALVLDTGANTLPFQVYILSCCCIHAQTHVCSESPWRLRPVSAVMGGQGGAQDVTSWKFEKGIKKIRWNQLLLLTPVAPHDKTLTLNHSDHLRGVRFKLVPICGSLYGSPGVTEVLTLLKSLYCFKNGAEALPKNRCVPVFFLFWGWPDTGLCFFLLGINESTLLLLRTWTDSLRLIEIVSLRH